MMFFRSPLRLLPSLGSFFGVGVAVSVAVSVSGCRVFDPPARPDELCARACMTRAKQCVEDACYRGCLLASDRWAEGEAKAVIDCVAAEDQRCTDEVWAKCAVRVGPHADGGPPAPPPPREWDEDDDDSSKPKKTNDDDLL